MELLTSARADDLSALLERINVHSVVYCRSELGAPWGFRVDGSVTAKFHLVLDGQATLTLDDPGPAPVELVAGDLVLLAHGTGHLMRDHGDSPTPPLADILAGRPTERLTYGGEGPRTSLLCGGFMLGSGLPDNPLGLRARAGRVPAPAGRRPRGAGGSGRPWLYVLTGKPRFTPPWLGSSQRDVTTLPRV